MNIYGLKNIICRLHTLGNGTLTVMMSCAALLSVGCCMAQNDRKCIGGAEYMNKVNAGAVARKSPGGMIIAGKGDSLRALEPFHGTVAKAGNYADAVNRYNKEFGRQARVYCMVIPTAVEYYCPDTARTWTQREQPVINGIYEALADSVCAVDVWTVLARHAPEAIYSRTDHHWAPLGAYYAAREFAGIAGVPFRDIEDYDRDTVRNYVGTMYRFSRDRAVKESPEEFVYYIPRDVEYTSTSVNYTLDKSRRRVISETAPKESGFFIRYSDGSSGAYCTFMGGDTKLVRVVTSTKNGRRLMILKDSFGNALPGYLFSSFEEIHVADCRYFTKNMREYVNSNNITDILFANNIGHACQSRIAENYINYLKQ